MKKLKIKLTHPKAKMPTKAHPEDAGYDLTAVSKIYLATPELQVEYNLGFAMQLPPNHVGLIFPRSSIRKYDLSLRNCVGVIDESFSGTVTATFGYFNKKESIYNVKEYEVGDRVAQLVVLPLAQLEIEQVDELDETERGSGAYGSTDAK